MTTTNYDAAIDAMRSLQTEGDRWNLGEQLLVLVPRGVATDDRDKTTFAAIIEAATAQGVGGKFKPTTLRLYRDTAARWPKDQRVPNVSFSAHREAMVLNDVNSQVRTLNDLVKTHGAGNVTVSRVRDAVRIKQGKGAKPAKAETPVAFDAITDIKHGAPKLIAAIPSSTSSADLDKLNAGLSKALAYVDRLRAKAAAKASKAKRTATTPKAPVKKATPGAKARAAAAAKGDTRGLR